MAAAGVEEDLAVQAARILLTLRKRKMLRWPEWVQKEPVPAAAAAAAVEVEVRWPLEGWPKRPRSGARLRGDWLDALSMPKLGGASVSAGSGACSSGEERDRRWRERRSRDELTAAARRLESPAYCSALAGSGPSTTTTADRKTRPRHAAVEKAAAAVAPVSASATAKEPMKVSSPETPLDFATSAAGSGASSSGDDAARPPSKRRADEAVGSGGGGASSGDEGCSSPDKRARVDAGDGDGDKAISEPKMQTPDDSKKAVKFEFDLNMLPEDEECPGFC